MRSNLTAWVVIMGRVSVVLLKKRLGQKGEKTVFYKKKYELFSSQIIRQIKSDRQTKAGLVGSTIIN